MKSIVVTAADEDYSELIDESWRTPVDATPMEYWHDGDRRALARRESVAE